MKAACDALGMHAATRPQALAVIDDDGTEHSWSAIQGGAARLCLAIGRDIPAGSAVGISVRSGARFWIAALGVARARCLPVLLPYPLPGAVRAKLAAEIAPALLIDEAWLDRLMMFDSVSQARRHAIDAPSAEMAVSDDSSAPFCGAVLLSSGTTGRSNFVLRSAAALDQIGQSLLSAGLICADDRIASFLPMAHAFGFEHAFLAPIMAGACVEAIGSFTVERAAEVIQRGATTIPLVPTTVAMLAEASLDRGRLRSCTVAGAPLAPPIRAAFESALGVPLVDLYGATELGTIWLDRGSGGVPIQGVDIRIVEPGNTSGLIDLPAGVEGEIAVRSNSIFEGTFGPGGALATVRRDDFFRTGDLGRCMDNVYQITGRVKLVFDVGGLKVNPIDIEQVLQTHPEVRVAMVHPIEVAPLLNRVGAWIEAVDPTRPPSVVELRTFLAPLVPAHAMPRSFRFVASIPRTASGKLLRSGLSAVSEADLAATPTTQGSAISPVRSRPPALQERAAREEFTRLLFDETAKGYDHSSGAAFLRSGRWYRRRMLLRNGLRVGSSHLDVGSGTGLCAAISQEIVGPTGRVVAMDPSEGMLAVARQRGVREIVVGRAESLPFADASFDLVTMSYMLRHVHELSVAFAQARRVLRPGGRLVILEVTRPTSPPARAAFRLAMHWVLPGLGVITSGRMSTFRMMKYWAETIDVALPPEQIVDAIERCHFTGARHQLELGIFSCYRGIVSSAAK